MNQLNILKTSFWTKKNFFVSLVSLLASINIYSKILHYLISSPILLALAITIPRGYLLVLKSKTEPSII